MKKKKKKSPYAITETAVVSHNFCLCVLHYNITQYIYLNHLFNIRLNTNRIKMIV